MEVDRWQREGVLVENIKKEFRKLPEDMRGDSLSHETYRPFLEEARTYLSPEDQQVENWIDVDPEAKFESFELLRMVLMGTGPNPIQNLWVAFGFCVCQSEHEEGVLGGTFLRLLNHSVRGAVKCTFDKFWRAHHAGQLISLMDSYNLKINPRVKRFWSSPEERKFSVWYLKQFLAINEPAKLDELRFQSVRLDYGFDNCRELEDICTLMEIYKRLLLVVDPLKLHQACIEGRLFEFANPYHEMKPE
ncbi:hypothetical protein HYALB_00004218 [Hymenoscyphus albidus]|uniref:Uncharacterized protein n=1 Tax=Hymenoscyphus albidus TaxID=595503 RepID=A0A9N9M3Y7_9HELO|nr:hypothetical protein HYALB_00004218 [Hymenoscyphus albidus]